MAAPETVSEQTLIADGRAPLIPSDLDAPWPENTKRIPAKTLARKIIEHNPRHRHSGVYRMTAAIWRMLDPSQGGQPIELNGYRYTAELITLRPSYRMSVTIVRRPVAALARAA